MPATTRHFGKHTLFGVVCKVRQPLNLSAVAVVVSVLSACALAQLTAAAAARAANAPIVHIRRKVLKEQEAGRP